jgi:hypothetical protein
VCAGNRSIELQQANRESKGKGAIDFAPFVSMNERVAIFSVRRKVLSLIPLLQQVKAFSGTTCL